MNAGGDAKAAGIRLSRRAGVLLMATIVIGTGILVPMRQLAAQREREAELRERVVYLRKANDRLGIQVDRLRDPRYLDRLARECLGLVKEGEIAFYPVPQQGELPPPRC